jgi:hypothetical protein
MGVDNFETSIPAVALHRLIHIGQLYGFDPLSSIEMESYFTRMLDTMTIDEIESETVPTAFTSLGECPRWLQGAEWPLENDEPLVFLGQFDFPSNSYLPGSTTSYFFCSRRNGQLRIVTQRDGI